MTERKTKGAAPRPRPDFSKFGRHRRHLFFPRFPLRYRAWAALIQKDKTGWPPIVGLPVLESVFLVAETADGKSVPLAIVAPAHVRVVVVQGAAPRVGAGLRRRPEDGAEACALILRIDADACRNGGKARRVVQTRVVAHITGP